MWMVDGDTPPWWSGDMVTVGKGGLIESSEKLHIIVWMEK